MPQTKTTFTRRSTMINPMKYGSPDWSESSSSPYSGRSSHSSGSSYDTPRRPVRFQDRPGPAYTTKKFCKECSAALDEKWKACPMCTTAVEKPITLKSVKPEMCSCGRKTQEDFRFCPSCAKPIDESWKLLPICTCGVLLAKDAKFCIGCGTRITCKSHETLNGHITSRP